MRYFLFLVLLVVSSNVSACYFATQNRLFPIGMSPDGLVFVEVRLIREDSYGDQKADKQEPEIGWRGKSYLKIYDSTYQEIYSELIDSLSKFHAIDYIFTLEKTVEKGFHLAEKFQNLKLFNLENLSFCFECEELKTEIDLVSNKYLLNRNNSLHYIPFFEDKFTLSSNIRNAHYGKNVKISSHSLLTIGSYRIFKVGDKSLLVTFLQSGTDTKETKLERSKMVTVDLNFGCFEEPILYHGHGFDFFVWLD